MVSDLHQRVLIFAVSRKDAQAAGILLGKAGIGCKLIPDAMSLFREMGQGAGALLIAKEALNPAIIKKLSHILDEQLRWSFLPVIILAAKGDLSGSGSKVLNLLESLRNVTLLERPVRTKTLLSIVKSAIADRLRQYGLRDVLLELEASKATAVAASDAKSSFLANMSHEIRTPLGSIIGFAELLAEAKASEPELLRFADTIRRNGQLLSSLVNDVLDLAKVEAGHLSIEALEVSTSDLVEDVVRSFETQAAAKGLTLKVDFDDNVPRRLVTDAVRIKQILMNVIGNAIKFTSAGLINVTLKVHDRVLQIRVADSGIGISPEQARKLFTPFSQADSSITRRFGGTGLGLALSRKLAVALGGELSLIQSEPGLGSTFEISIPCVVPDTGLGDPVAPHGTTAPSLKGLRVLVADDSEDNQYLITYFLRSRGAATTTADNGLLAVEAASHGVVDLVLMDVQMPVMGGYEAAKQLRSRGFTKPIIALTAHALKEDRERALAAGCDEYLTKPIEREKLFEAIHRLRVQSQP